MKLLVAVDLSFSKKLFLHRRVSTEAYPDSTVEREDVAMWELNVTADNSRCLINLLLLIL